jgi:hypothetical protein
MNYILGQKINTVKETKYFVSVSHDSVCLTYINYFVEITNFSCRKNYVGIVDAIKVLFYILAAGFNTLWSERLLKIIEKCK